MRKLYVLFWLLTQPFSGLLFEHPEELDEEHEIIPFIKVFWFPITLTFCIAIAIGYYLNK